MKHGLFGTLSLLLAGAAALAQPGPEFRPATGYYHPMAPAIYQPQARMMAPAPMYYPGQGYYPPQMVQPGMMYPPAPMYYPPMQQGAIPVQYAQPLPSAQTTRPATPVLPYSVNGSSVVPQKSASLPSPTESLTSETTPGAPVEEGGPAMLPPTAEGTTRTAPITTSSSGPACDAGCDTAESKKGWRWPWKKSDHCSACDTCKETKKTSLFSWPPVKKEKHVHSSGDSSCPPGQGGNCATVQGGNCPPNAGCEQAGYCQGKPKKKSYVYDWPVKEKCNRPYALYGNCNNSPYGLCDYGCDYGCAKNKAPWECDEDTGPACFWFGAEYLQWAIDSPSIPAIARQFPDGGPTTFGGNDANFDGLSGVRASLGFRVCGCVSFEMEGFRLFETNSTDALSTTTAGTPPLNILLTDLSTGIVAPRVIATLGGPVGSISATSTAEMLGAEGNVVLHLYCGNYKFFNLFWGIRYLQLEESFDLSTISNNLAGVVTQTQDVFSTKNNFLGAQFGFQTGWQRGPFFCLMGGKVAGGVNQEEVSVRGSTTVTGAAPTTTGILTTGLLGTGRSDEVFAFAPEFRIQFGVQLCKCMALTGGYTALYMSDVARPADQIVFGTNAVRVPGVEGTSFYTHGYSAGMAFRW